MIDVSELAKVIIDVVVKLNGLLELIISDCNKKGVS